MASTTTSDADEPLATMSGPLACFLSSLRAELSATDDVRIVVDNAASASSCPGRLSAGHRTNEEMIDRRHSQRANRWQTETSSAHSQVLERAVQHPLANLGPTMPRRRRSLDEEDDGFCQAIRECTVRGGDQRVMRMPQRVCSSELTLDALFPDKTMLRVSSAWERNERVCHTGWH
jgi:hypothetical protein